MFNLTGKTALVTGASGRHRRRDRRGAARAGRDASRCPARARGARGRSGALELGDRVHVAVATSPIVAAVDALVPEAEAALGGLDILVNNAGITRDDLFLRMKDEDWETVIAVNLKAAFRLSRAALKGMMRQRFGRIIGITSVVGVTGNRRPGQLRRLEGRADRHVEGAGAGGREPRHHGELRRAGLHRERR